MLSKLPPALLALALAFACSVPAAAGAPPSATAAAAGTGKVTLTLGTQGKAAHALAREEVGVKAVAPASRRGAKLKLPVARVAVRARSATVVLRGGIRFKAGKRALKVRALRVALAARKASVIGRAGKRKVRLFVAPLPKGRAKLNAEDAVARLAASRLKLSSKGAALLRKRLGLERLPAGLVGKLAVSAREKTSQAPDPAPPLSNEPPVLARPAGAVDVTGGQMIWRPRASWICYINGGEGTSVFGGVTNGPVESVPCTSGSTDLVASFQSFPFKSGWAHPDGRVALYFGGGVGFRWSDHGIDFTTADPEIEINGAASRAIFRFNGSDDTPFPNRRGVLVNTTPGTPTVEGGRTTYADIPGRIPSDTGASVFAGFYPENAPFGTITVSFDTP